MSQGTVTKTTRDRCGNYVHTITCAKCKRERTLTTNVEKPEEPWTCFECWKVEKGLP
jgi:hypothetical protein